MKIIMLICVICIFLIGCSSFENTQSQTVLLQFSPTQCVEDPWDVWINDMNETFYQTLSIQDRVLMYYSQEHDILFENVFMVMRESRVCTECFVCQKEYYILGVSSYYSLSNLERLGWSENIE